jgi:hypothetical protein
MRREVAVTASRTALIARSSRLAVLGACVLGASACGGSSSSSPSSPSPSTSPTQTAAPIQYVSVTGNFLIGAVGGTTQLKANANTTSGSQDVTSQATWTSSNESVATVSSGGLVSARGTGLAVITASYQGISGPGGLSVATAVNVTGTWRGTSANPTSDITLQLTQAGDSVSGSSTTIGGGVSYTGSMTGTVNGGTVILAGSVSSSSGSLFSSWTDERCALENATTLRCVNPMTLATGGLTRLEVTLVRQ